MVASLSNFVDDQYCLQRNYYYSDVAKDGWQFLHFHVTKDLPY